MLSEFCRSRGIIIDINGRITKLLPLADYQSRVTEFAALILLTIILTIIRQCEYVPITVIGNTVYARIIASALNRQHISTRLSRTHNRTTLYQVLNADAVPFDGDTISTQSSSIKLPVLPCLVEELQELEDHTGLTNLAAVQELVLRDYDKLDGIYLASMDELVQTSSYSEPIVSIDKFTSSLYYVRSAKRAWLTRLIITDNVDPLEAHDVIVGYTLDFSTRDREQLPANNKYEQVVDCDCDRAVIRNEDEVVVYEDELAVTMKQKSLYYVEHDLTITAYPNNLATSTIYQLRQPREFINENLAIVHPYHLPLTWDPCLALTIVSLALATEHLNNHTIK